MTTESTWAQVSSSDLFDGDILGDELIDIYNAVGGEDDAMVQEIPSLLAPETPIAKQGDSAPGIQMKSSTSELPPLRSSELPPLRPSGSFTDLVDILPAPVNVAASGAPAQAQSKSTKKAPAKSKSATKKRASTTAAGAPAAKRRASTKKTTTAKRSSPASKAKTAQVPLAKKATPVKTPSAKSAGLANIPKGTPNPLSKQQAASNAAATVATSSKKSAIVVKAEAGSTATSAPAVVSPRSKLNQAKTASGKPGAPLPTMNTEADFRAVAQSAVSNLISNVKPSTTATATKAPTTTSAAAKAATVAKASSKGAAEKASSAAATAASNGNSNSKDKVNISTEHIKALTGSNWVSVCGGGGAAAAGGGAASSQETAKRRQNLTADERAKQNRDRNREHARNTRLRKKAYVEELKRTLTELVNQRDASEAQSQHSAQRELEQREVRFRVLEEFLKLRGRNELSSARWSAILEDNFSLTIPVTHYRNMVHLEPNDPTSLSYSEQELTGVSTVMADAKHAFDFFQHALATRGEAVTMSYHCDRGDFMMDDCKTCLDWTATTSGAIANGTSAELFIKGNIQAKFSPASNKLLSAKISFDTGAVSAQLQILQSKEQQQAPLDHSAAAAVQAANEAHAILDSLQMPHIDGTVPSNVLVVPASSVSGSSSADSVASNSDKEDVAAVKKQTA